MNKSPSEPTPRQVAARAGEKTYVGRACVQGHLLRYTSNGACVVCTRAQALEHYREIARMRQQAGG